MAKNAGDDEQRAHDPSAHEIRADSEKTIQRNPHPDFAKVQASRPDWPEHPERRFTKVNDPNWKPGQGGNDGGESLKKEHVEIDPYEEGRPASFNYKLLISGIIPRFIGFISTRSEDSMLDQSPADSEELWVSLTMTREINKSGAIQLHDYGESREPFVFSLLCCRELTLLQDPPIFVVGYAGGYDNAKDSLKNLVDTKECVINVISEHFIEAANFTSINAPYGISEWAISGLHPASCTTVKASRVKEAIFSVEGKLVETKEFESRATPGKKTGVLAIIEGTRFWAREDAINKDRNLLDPTVLRPVSRLGGISYGRTAEFFELPRPDFEETRKKGELEHLIKPKADGQ